MIKIIFSHKCKACFLGRTFQAKAIKKPKTIGRIIQSQVNEKQMNNVTDINKQRKAQKLKDEGF